MDERIPAVNRNGRSPLLLFGGALLLGLALVLLLFGGSLFGEKSAESDLSQIPALNQPAAISSGILSIGDNAPSFTLADLSGNDITLDQYSGQPIIINFWATWCPPCRLEMPEFQNLFEAHQADGLVILAVNLEESASQVQSFFYDEMNFTFTPLLDSEGAVTKLYSVSSFPTTYFVNREGAITAVHRGALFRSQLDGYLADILPAPG